VKRQKIKEMKLVIVKGVLSVSELKIGTLFFIHFHFHPHFIYLFILDLGRGYGVTLYKLQKHNRSITPVTWWSHMSQLWVTQSHDTEKILKQIKLLYIVIVCWSYREYIDFRVG